MALNQVKIDKDKLEDVLYVQLSGYDVIRSNRDPGTRQYKLGYDDAIRDVLKCIRTMPCEVRVAWNGVDPCKCSKPASDILHLQPRPDNPAKEE